MRGLPARTPAFQAWWWRGLQAECARGCRACACLCGRGLAWRLCHEVRGCMGLGHHPHSMLAARCVDHPHPTPHPPSGCVHSRHPPLAPCPSAAQPLPSHAQGPNPRPPPHPWYPLCVHSLRRCPYAPAHAAPGATRSAVLRRVWCRKAPATTCTQRAERSLSRARGQGGRGLELRLGTECSADGPRAPWSWPGSYLLWPAVQCTPRR